MTRLLMTNTARIGRAMAKARRVPILKADFCFGIRRTFPAGGDLIVMPKIKS
jgi:hypothetical protein